VTKRSCWLSANPRRGAVPYSPDKAQAGNPPRTPCPSPSEATKLNADAIQFPLKDVRSLRGDKNSLPLVHTNQVTPLTRSPTSKLIFTSSSRSPSFRGYSRSRYKPVKLETLDHIGNPSEVRRRISDKVTRCGGRPWNGRGNWCRPGGCATVYLKENFLPSEFHFWRPSWPERGSMHLTWLNVGQLKRTVSNRGWQPVARSRPCLG